MQARQARKFGVAPSGPQAVSPGYLCIGVKRRESGYVSSPFIPTNKRGPQRGPHTNQKTLQ